MMLMLVQLKIVKSHFLEGYLWDEGDPKKAFDKAIEFTQHKTAMSLSDPILRRST